MFKILFIVLLSALTTTRLSFGRSLAYGSIKFISLINRPCQAKEAFVYINSNDLLYYPFTVSINKGSGRSNIIDDPMLKYVLQMK